MSDLLDRLGNGGYMRVKITIVVFTLSLIPGNLFSGTKEEVIRLQSDVLQLQNLVRTLRRIPGGFAKECCSVPALS